MPSALKSNPTAAIAAIATPILTAGATSTNTIIGLNVSNTSNVGIKASVQLKRGSNSYYIIKDGPIPVGNTLACVGIEGKVVMQPNDQLIAWNDIGTIDAIVSYLEQTP